MVGTILAAIIGVSMIAALYLNVTARTTLVGREIQNLEWETSNVEEENANLKTELARLLSHDEITKRSDALSFRPATAEETHYIAVSGYEGKAPVNLTNKNMFTSQNDLLSEAYTQSLFDWFGQQIEGGSRR